MHTEQPKGRPHSNQGLFSDHYLNATLPERPDWRELADEARPALEEIASLLDSYTPSENEAQVCPSENPREVPASRGSLSSSISNILKEMAEKGHLERVERGKRIQDPWIYRLVQNRES